MRYPITITALLKKPNDDIPRLSPLLIYKYKTIVTEYPEFGEEVQVEKEFSSQYDAPIEGKLERWFVEVGTVIQDCDVDILEIEEPCTHAVQFAGLCSMCGKDMTEQDYTYFSNKDRATIQLAHDNTGLTVSSDEASRLEEDAKKRLLKSKKLSLVVDLDQTIIHACVDPTVGEWKNDPYCINHESVKDVEAFKLDEDIVGGRGTWYYVKMRPGLKQFLEAISKLYELHIYTMGTRAYALSVKKIVDPDGTIFGERVLSRDESGSMTQKSLQRLFPVDTKMVVIIDDRGDVWKWSDNLVKVRPYDFFVGIGDINSSFLPKRQEFPTAPTPPLDAAPALTTPADPENPSMQPGEDLEGLQNETLDGMANKSSTLEQLVNMGAGDDQNLLTVQTEDLDKAITAQKHDRPLTRKQEEQDKKDEKMAESITVEAIHTENGDETPSEIARQKHSVLQDHDRELYALERHLTAVHKAFYDEFDRKRKSNAMASVTGRRRPGQSEARLDLKAVPDIKDIMPLMKQSALGDVTLVFSGVIPLGANVQSYDITLWAKSFGATVVENISGKVTHLVAARSRTAKVRQAAVRYPKIKIVSPQWLWESISNWKKEDEEPYLITIHPEDRHMGSLNGFEDDHPDAPLLSSEDDSDMEEDISSNPADELNAPDMANVGWMDVDEEFKEWIGSDDDGDDVSENESMASASTVKSTLSQRRTKRSRSSTPHENDDSIMDETMDKSRHKRQRALSDRSLEAAATAAAGGLSETSDAALEDADDHESLADEDHNENDDDDDSFAAEFEREFWAATDDDEETEDKDVESEVATEKESLTKEGSQELIAAENGDMVGEKDSDNPKI